VLRPANAVSGRLEAADGTYFHRLTLAPGEDGRHRHLRTDAARHAHLEERAGECDWVAWEQRDHSPTTHVHVIAVLDRRLDRNDLRDLREQAMRPGGANVSGYGDPMAAELDRGRDHDRTGNVSQRRHSPRAPRPCPAGMAPATVSACTPLLVIAILGALIGAFISVAPQPAPESTTASPSRAGPGAIQNASPPPSLFPQTRTEHLVLGAIFTLAVLPIAAVSLRAAAWYWGIFAGPMAAGSLLILAAPPHTPDAIAWIVLLAVWVGPLLSLRTLRKRRPIYTAGERWATQADLRTHQLELWPQPGPQMSAGTRWRSTRTWWQLTRKTALRPTVYGLDASREGRHTFAAVPTGLGKGLWTVTQLLTWDGSAIVNDLKGDTYPLTAGWRHTQGPIYVLSAASPIHRFDPTAAVVTEDDLRPLAYAVCDDPTDRDGYWGQHASRILLVLMLAAKQAGEPVFPFVARAIRGGPARALALAAEIDPSLTDRVKPPGESRPFTSAWETLVTRCESLISPVTLATMSGSDFTASDLLRERATVYVQVPEARLGDLRPFLRLLWTSLIAQLVTASDRMSAAHHPLLLILDEAGRTPFAGLPDFLVTLRSRRISCAVLVQALSQLRVAYGEQASTILGNCSVHIYARSEDLATQEYVSERLGAAEEVLGTEARTSGPHGASVTHGQLRRFRPLLTPQQVRTMRDRQILTFLPACPPAALARMDWRQHLALARRSVLRPPDAKPVEVLTASPPPLSAAGYVEPDQ
jgi:hypothetical protein